tara:strand:- start:1665 stop:1805 length:141 start_codon:yes stop_codon:yes gene_type:complete
MDKEIMLMWIIVGLIMIPLCIVQPLIIVAGIFIYAVINLYKHYSNG